MSEPNKCFALLIGCAQYQPETQLSALPNADEDTKALKAALCHPDICGFPDENVRVLANPDRYEMLGAIHEFFSGSRTDELRVLYFAGHGILFEDYFSLACHDALPEIPETGVSRRILLDYIKQAKARKILVLLDCCHAAGVFEGRRSGAAQLQVENEDFISVDQVSDEASMDSATGTYLLCACSKIERAAEAEPKVRVGHGLFTQHLLNALYAFAEDLECAQLNIDQLYATLYRRVCQDSGQRQRPHRFMLRGNQGQWALARKTVRLIPAHILTLIASTNSDERMDGARLLARAVHESEQWAAVALARLQKWAQDENEITRIHKFLGHALSQAAPEMRAHSASIAVHPEPERRSERSKVAVSPIVAEKSIYQTPTMIKLPAGQFLMGAAAEEVGANPDEWPQHTVAVAAFDLAENVVTFDEYAYFCQAKNRPLPEHEGWGRGSRPVINVSWEDARCYAAWLAELTGQPFRLPTEAEWEYAARAGTQTVYAFAKRVHTDRVNYDGRYADEKNHIPKTGVYYAQTLPVERLDAANAWGLRHMYGNVWEWVQDCWHANYQGAPEDGSAWLGENDRHVLRGGSWFSFPGSLRAAFRNGGRTDNRDGSAGFRLARTADPLPSEL